MFLKEFFSTNNSVISLKCQNSERYLQIIDASSQSPRVIARNRHENGESLQPHRGPPFLLAQFPCNVLHSGTSTEWTVERVKDSDCILLSSAGLYLSIGRVKKKAKLGIVKKVRTTWVTNLPRFVFLKFSNTGKCCAWNQKQNKFIVIPMLSSASILSVLNS